MFNPVSLPLLMAELAVASTETILHRSLLMATGDCTLAEYTRMVTEKMTASSLAAGALLAGESMEAVLAPYHSRATANAKRLRGRK
ncbi:MULTISPECIES: hypothetical protein [Streptomyces]|uniref:Uncharacterized protein n=2 Tax=Streptomyces TaxID=1883 RepID=A0ABU4K114_9ACTN|nr:hypothetical protein [Streptomyces roseolus]MDX2291456.1 hypothetical protein [Streptomyces roseolus]